VKVMALAPHIAPTPLPPPPSAPGATPGVNAAGAAIGIGTGAEMIMIGVTGGVMTNLIETAGTAQTRHGAGLCGCWSGQQQTGSKRGLYAA
jgi:hypothetical protein